MMVVSIRCLLSQRSTQTSQLSVGCLSKQAAADSWGPLWKSTAKSLKALALGHDPDLKQHSENAYSCPSVVTWNGLPKNSIGQPQPPISGAHIATATISMMKASTMLPTTIFAPVPSGEVWESSLRTVSLSLTTYSKHLIFASPLLPFHL